MTRVEPGAGIAFAADGMTVAAGGFNAAWLALHRAGTRQPARRIAALTLATINAGAAATTTPASPASPSTSSSTHCSRRSPASG